MCSRVDSGSLWAGMEMAYNEGASWASWRKSRPGCLTIPGVGRPKELGED